MSEDKKLIINGYQPEISKKGYQPEKLQGVHVPAGEPVQGGYQPTSEGDNPSNKPSPPPGDE